MSPRILYALAVCVLILGGAGTFLGKKAPMAESADFAYTQAAKSYALELTPTFSMEKDPFALNPADDPALIVRLGSKEVLRLDSAPPGQAVVLNDVPGLVRGMNEFSIQATPSADGGTDAQALRVRLLENGLPVAEQSFWTSRGMPVNVAFRVALEEDKGGADAH